MTVDSHNAILNLFPIQDMVSVKIVKVVLRTLFGYLIYKKFFIGGNLQIA